MNSKLEIFSNLFEDREIRSIWDSEKEDYYFSVINVISILTKTNNPYKYWNNLKLKLENEGSKLSQKIIRLKVKNQEGKLEETDALDIRGIFRLMLSISSPNAEPFKLWLANLGSERIDEVFDPEKTINRAINYYRNKGYSYEWIKMKLKSIINCNKIVKN